MDFGTAAKTGDADFSPNGAMANQPGCTGIPLLSTTEQDL